MRQLKLGKPGQKLSSTSMASKSGKRIEVEEVTTEMLDQLLAELTSNGCENKLKTEPSKKIVTKHTTNDKSTEQKSENVVSLLSYFRFLYNQ